jgi:hypothetical protein
VKTGDRGEPLVAIRPAIDDGPVEAGEAACAPGRAQAAKTVRKGRRRHVGARKAGSGRAERGLAIPTALTQVRTKGARRCDGRGEATCCFACGMEISQQKWSARLATPFRALFRKCPMNRTEPVRGALSTGRASERSRQHAKNRRPNPPGEAGWWHRRISQDHRVKSSKAVYSSGDPKPIMFPSVNPATEVAGWLAEARRRQ